VFGEWGCGAGGEGVWRSSWFGIEAARLMEMEEQLNYERCRFVVPVKDFWREKISL
jgi:hypothetical protein